MSEFTKKQTRLRVHYTTFLANVRRVFPVDGPISWRTENSFTQSGTVVAHAGERFRVIDDSNSFYSMVTVADILRAQT